MSRCGECPEWIRKNCEENLSLEDCIDTLQMAVWDSAPTIEIVRCKECKHWVNGEDYDCEKRLSAWKPDDFCSYGERREQ